MCCKQGRIDHHDCVESCSLPRQCQKLSYRKINGPRKQPLPCIRAKTEHTQNTSINQHNCTKQGISQMAPRLCIQFAQHLLCQKKYRTSQPGWFLQKPLKHRAANGSPKHTQTQLPAAECRTHMPLPNTPTAVVPRMHPQASLP